MLLRHNVAPALFLKPLRNKRAALTARSGQQQLVHLQCRMLAGCLESTSRREFIRVWSWSYPFATAKRVAETRLGSGHAFILDLSTEVIAIALPTYWQLCLARGQIENLHQQFT